METHRYILGRNRRVDLKILPIKQGDKMSRGRAVLKLTLSCQLLTFYLILSVLPLHSQDIPFQKENPKDTAKEITAAVNGAPITSNLLEIRTKQLSSVSSFHGRISDKELEEIKKIGRAHV